MATEVLMPKLGLTMTEGTVQEWYKKEGDPVKKGEVICLIASEKLTMEVEAEADGFLTKIIAEVDEDIPVKTAAKSALTARSGTLWLSKASARIS